MFVLPPCPDASTGEFVTPTPPAFPKPPPFDVEPGPVLDELPPPLILEAPPGLVNVATRAALVDCVVDELGAGAGDEVVVVVEATGDDGEVVLAGAVD